MTTQNRIVTLALWVFAASCGGFKYKISDALLADIPIAEKQTLLSIKDERTQLKQVRAKVRSEINIAKRDRSAAYADYKIAKNGVDKVQADVALAQTTTDVNRIERAKARLAVAELGRRTADTKLTWRESRLQHSKQQLRVVEAQQHHAAARYEQEKARLAASKGKTPYEKFSLIQFDAQVSEAQALLDKERVAEDRLRQESIQLEARYQSEKQQLEAARSGAPTQAVPPAPPLSMPVPAAPVP